VVPIEKEKKQEAKLSLG